MKRTLITGGTGFVGANLARRLLRDGHDVHLIVRHGYAKWRVKSIISDVNIHEIDLSNRNMVDAVVGKIQPDWIFHLAAYGAYSSQTDSRIMIQTNLLATVNLVEACLKTGFEAFVNAGSSSEYGFKDHAPSESEWLEPNSYYSVTKASATMFCRHVALSHSARLITLRLYSVYGPWEEPTRLIPTLIIRGVDGKLPPLVSHNIARDYVYIDDVIEAFLLAAGRIKQETGAVYNIGTGKQTPIRHVTDLARRTMNIAAKPQWGSMPNRKWDTAVWLADNRAARKALGWQPRYTFDQGFRKTASWFLENPAMVKFYQTHQNLPT